MGLEKLLSSLHSCTGTSDRDAPVPLLTVLSITWDSHQTPDHHTHPHGHPPLTPLHKKVSFRSFQCACVIFYASWRVIPPSHMATFLSTLSPKPGILPALPFGKTTISEWACYRPSPSSPLGQAYTARWYICITTLVVAISKTLSGNTRSTIFPTF